MDPNITMYCGKLYLKEDTEHEEKARELNRVQAQITVFFLRSKVSSIDVKRHAHNKDIVSKYLDKI